MIVGFSVKMVLC